MYRIKEKKKEEIKTYRTNLYVRKIGVAQTYISNIINGNQKCSEIIARALLSVRFNISLYDDRIDELLEEYFRKE